ncbi:MAG: ribosome assembly RNA-binding protein YhbY [Spirochaetes bacterium]|nr:ribosome assembly RNA-binding protein YhbY [Spirochaetota bacterium]
MKPHTAGEKKSLKARAHHLRPVVYIGRGGMSDAVVQATETALADHGLIKVKFIDFKNEKKELAEELAGKTGSSLVALIGNIAILYRPDEDPPVTGNKSCLPHFS